MGQCPQEKGMARRRVGGALRARIDDVKSSTTPANFGAATIPFGHPVAQIFEQIVKAGRP
jgi:hypothetical protein